MTDERRSDERPHDARGATAGCGSPRLDEAVRALREPVPVRAEWRDALLREVAAESMPGARRGGWTITPLRAAAAALLCAGLGAAATYGAMVGRDGGAAVAARVSPTAATPVSTPAQVASSGATTVRFTITAAGASRVSVVGDFNRWDPAATPLRRVDAAGTWEVAVPLTPGRHVYAFVVDGGVTTDPAAPRAAADDDYGAPNSVVFVSGPRT